MREACARVRENFLLRESGITGINDRDGRRIEVVATGLSFGQGVPLAIDCTLVSPLKSDGCPHHGAARSRGNSLAHAERLKHRTYPELVNSSILRLVVAAIETGGRMHRDIKALLFSAAYDRALSEPVILRSAAQHSLYSRWITMLSVATQDALASTLISEGLALLDCVPGAGPTAADLLLDAGFDALECVDVRIE